MDPDNGRMRLADEYRQTDRQTDRQTETVASIPGHTLEFEKDFKRNIDVFIQEPSKGVNENTGYFLILHPGTAGADSWYYERLREEWSDRYNVVAIGVNYLGTINREFYYKGKPKWTREAANVLFSNLTPQQRAEIDAWDREDLHPITAMMRMLPPNFDATKLIALQEEIPHRERADYRDYGYIQTMDCLYALRYAMNLYEGRTNKNRTYVLGSCLSGHLAQICAKFAPNTFCLVADNSGFAEMKKQPFLYTEDLRNTSFSDNGFRYTLVQEAFYSDDPQSKYYLYPDMIDIRNMTVPRHLKVFKALFKGKIVMFHGADDDTINVEDRKRMQALFRAEKIDSQLKIFTQKDVDGTIIKSAGHGMGADLKLLFEKYCDAYVLENSKSAIRKEGPSDFERRSVIKYPGTGGTFSRPFYHLIDYTGDFPGIHFIH